MLQLQDYSGGQLAKTISAQKISAMHKLDVNPAHE
ncbi:protein of unknown function (plasmid) [Cupriavidus taiwanensis]|uniref:Uncharacterized protein n=1 Tax=Cupriavidus taiwanensis TaxID=164546 RepID=A0A375IX36_9BURK|nr:protein of unknown function [Cupriavidus taiwanensis]